ncbi:MAG TPA: carboxylesterase family protein [Roseiflexaceae bacterium]|nr:carboxylesterase family protein [Roseiflexaceae bacterium]
MSMVPMGRQAMSIGILLVALPIALAGCGAERPGSMVNSDPAVVQTEGGAVRGTVGEDHRTFQGIPYAAPPVGERRWQSPQPAASWSDIRDATKPGAICPQQAELFADVSSVDENCLFLNITAPHPAGAQPKPVMVWVHGGGGANGAGSLFDARRLAVTGDVVVVTINYRLGILGAFGYPGLEGSGTFGLQDQQAALRWVQRNIARFGGDPGNVTLFGESYGAYAVAAQLIAPGANNLFHRAALQSNLALHDYPPGTLMPGTEALPSLWMSTAEAEGLGALIAGELGCADPATGLACLRALPVETLLPQSAIFSRYAYGGPALPLAPPEALRTGQFHRVPVLSGATRDEARLFVGLFYELAGDPVTAERYPQLLAEAFGDAADRVAAEYPIAEYGSPSLAWAAVITDRVWALSTHRQNLLLAAHVPTYAFEFADGNAPPNVPFPPEFPPGAYHNAEVVYQFDLAGEAAALSPEQGRLAEQMNRYWANFARSGDPNGADLPVWQRFDPSAAPPFVQALAPGAGGIAPVDYVAEHRLDFWTELGQ